MVQKRSKVAQEIIDQTTRVDKLVQRIKKDVLDVLEVIEDLQNLLGKDEENGTGKN